MLAQNIVSVAIITSLLIFSGCTNDNDEDTLFTGFLPTEQMTIIEGLDCPINPTDIYRVGTIYRKDPKTGFNIVKDLNGDALLSSHIRKNQRVADYTFSNTKKNNAEASISLLKKIVPGFSVDVDAAKKNSISIQVTAKNIRSNSMDDPTEEKVVSWAKENIKVKPKNQYFVIRRIYKAGAVSYLIRKKDLSRIGAKAELDKIASSSANLSIRDNDGSLSLDQTFDPRIIVCTKSTEITSQLVKLPVKK